MIKIGIVDDHQIVIDGLIALLKNENSIEISLTANTGKEMLDLLSTQKVDVLLTDVMMPEMNGLELAEMVAYFIRASKFWH